MHFWHPLKKAHTHTRPHSPNNFYWFWKLCRYAQQIWPEGPDDTVLLPAEGKLLAPRMWWSWTVVRSGNLSATWNLCASLLVLAQTLYGVWLAGQFTNFTAEFGNFGGGWCNLRKVHPGEISLLKGISNDVWPLHTDVSSVVQLQFVVIANLLLKVILTKYEDFKMKLDLNVDQICINLRCSAWLQKQQQFQSAARQQITLRRILVVALGSSSRSSSSTSRDRKTILIFSRIFRVSETKKTIPSPQSYDFPIPTQCRIISHRKIPKGKKERKLDSVLKPFSQEKEAINLDFLNETNDILFPKSTSSSLFFYATRKVQMSTQMKTCANETARWRRASPLGPSWWRQFSKWLPWQNYKTRLRTHNSLGSSASFNQKQSWTQ